VNTTDNMPTPQTKPQPTASEWKWYWAEGTEPEVMHLADSREDAIAAALDGCHLPQATICEGTPMQLRVNFLAAARVLDMFIEHNEDLQSEDGELFDMTTTPAQDAELEAALEAAFVAWRSKHRIGRSWALDTRNDEVIAVPPPAHD
jgi:hypothetical protein